MQEVLNKRRSEMVDIISGMETLSLQKLLSTCPMLIDVVFPTSSVLCIDPSTLKRMLKVDPSQYLGVAEHENAINWLKMYIDECAKGNLDLIDKQG